MRTIHKEATVSAVDCVRLCPVRRRLEHEQMELREILQEIARMTKGATGGMHAEIHELATLATMEAAS
jgi:hypothetical protein